MYNRFTLLTDHKATVSHIHHPLERHSSNGSQRWAILLSACTYYTEFKLNKENECNFQTCSTSMGTGFNPIGMTLPWFCHIIIIIMWFTLVDTYSKLNFQKFNFWPQLLPKQSAAFQELIFPEWDSQLNCHWQLTSVYSLWVWAALYM